MKSHRNRGINFEKEKREYLTNFREVKTRKLSVTLRYGAGDGDIKREAYVNCP